MNDDVNLCIVPTAEHGENQFARLDALFSPYFVPRTRCGRQYRLNSTYIYIQIIYIINVHFSSGVHKRFLIWEINLNK